jgi:hypothetical protein
MITKNSRNSLEGWMTKQTVPHTSRWFYGTETKLSKRVHRRWNRIEPISTFAVQNRALREPILNKKKSG